MSITRRTFAVGGVSMSVISSSSSFAHGAKNPRVWWPDNKAAAVSLTYDDGLDSQLENAVPALERLGLKATFFLTPENMQARVRDWQAVAKKGHEIADHTFHHPCALKGYSADRFEREELEPTERYLDDQFGPGPRTYAYPCGVIELGPGGQLEGELTYIRMLRGRFIAARAADGDPNDPRLVAHERYQLKAIAPTFDRDDPAIALRYVQKTVSWRRWAILIFHNVLAARMGEGDTTIATHDRILERVSRPDIWCAPMGEVFSHLVKPS
jgi:peptidoglycan/xylan/chitin deacetylase (PgdA/CDA1 family)